MNYVTEITVIRNTGLKFISMILLNFQIFTIVRKKHSTIFVHSDLKWPFIKSSINNIRRTIYFDIIDTHINYANLI